MRYCSVAMRRFRQRKGFRAVAADLDAAGHKLELAVKHAEKRYPADRRLIELVSEVLDEVDKAATAVLWLGAARRGKVFLQFRR